MHLLRVHRFSAVFPPSDFASEGVLSSLATTDATQETGKSGAKDATGTRNRNAHLLYDNLLAIQNAADLQWPDDHSANAGLRDEFRLNTFPPRGRNGGKPDQPPAPPAPPPPP